MILLLILILAIATGLSFYDLVHETDGPENYPGHLVVFAMFSGVLMLVIKYAVGE